MSEKDRAINSNIDPLWDKKQVALYLKCSVETIKKQVQARRIPFVKLSARCIRFRRQDIEKWLADRTITPYRVPLSLVEKGR